MKRLLILLITAVFAAGAPEHADLLPLTVIDVWPEQYLEARVRVATALLDHKLEPREYYAEVEAHPKEGAFEFHLWHESALENRDRTDIRGDPTGKCRTVIYDTSAKKVVQIYGWK
jgi:hypothetical protein